MHLLHEYALQLVGVPYRWGGSSPVDGLDCSGLVQFLLAAVGIDPPGDQTAEGLFNHFLPISALDVRELGALAFYGKGPKEISHVALCLDGHRMIEAGGGNHLTLTRADAAAKGACVRIRMIDSRKDLIAVMKPDYGAFEREMRS